MLISRQRYSHCAADEDAVSWVLQPPEQLPPAGAELECQWGVHSALLSSTKIKARKVKAEDHAVKLGNIMPVGSSDVASRECSFSSFPRVGKVAPTETQRR